MDESGLYPRRSLPFGTEHGGGLLVAQRKPIEPLIKIFYRPVHVDILKELRVVFLGHPQQHQGGVGTGDVPAVHPQGKFADRLLLHGLDGRLVVTGHTVTVKLIRILWKKIIRIKTIQMILILDIWTEMK